MKSLVKYRRLEDRSLVTENPNGVSSSTTDGKHLPIIDLDFSHHYEPSTNDGHAHLYLNVPISYFRWVVLMFALRFAKVIEPGYFLWSIRRGHNQVRYPGLEKQETEKGFYTHGWFFKQRPHKSGKREN